MQRPKDKGSEYADAHAGYSMPSLFLGHQVNAREKTNERHYDGKDIGSRDDASADHVGKILGGHPALS